MANPFRISNLKKAYFYCRKNGLGAALSAAGERLQREQDASYSYEAPSPERLREQREVRWEQPPLLSVAVPAYETGEAYLTALIDSLLAQTYENWELILADASVSDAVERVAKRFTDSRIRYIRLSENQGIAQNTNAAFELAKGAYIGLLDHDDLLTPDALFEMAARIVAGRQGAVRPRLLYSDEDKTEETGTRFFEPYRKPEFNENLLLSNNYICHFLVLERKLAQKLRERPAFDGAQDYDLILRAVEQLRPEEIAHVPRALYHWRCHSASTAANPRSKRYAYEAGRRAVQAYCDRRGWNAGVEHSRHLGFYRIVYKDGILAARPEIGAVGGRLLKRSGFPPRSRVAGGLYERDGSVCFAGLPAAYSGPFHQASLQQDAFAVDLRCVRVQPALQPLLEKYRDRLRKAQRQEETARRLSLRFCAEVRAAGYRIVWDPYLEAEPQS